MIDIDKIALSAARMGVNFAYSVEDRMTEVHSMFHYKVTFPLELIRLRLWQKTQGE